MRLQAAGIAGGILLEDSGGRGYQTRINAALRKVVEEEMKGAK